MNKRQDAERIRHALDAFLSGLQDDPWLAQRVVAAAKGGKKVKKKVSVGLVVAIALAMLAATALAALSLNAYYENVMQREGTEGRIEDWSAESLTQLVDWMGEAGVELDETKLAALRDTSLPDDERKAIALELIDGYYASRDGVLTSVDIIAKEKGPIEYWSLEDKNWLSDMLAQYQPEEVAHGRNLLPGEEDVSEEEAKASFFAALGDEYGKTEKDFDLDTLSTSFGSGRVTIGDTTEENARYWTFTVQTSDHQDSATGYIRANGEAMQVTLFGAAEPRTWRDDYAADRVTFEARTSAEGFYRWLHKWKPILDEMIESGEIDPNAEEFARSDLMYWYGITDVVGLPREGDLPQEEARELADAAIEDRLGWTEKELACFLPWASYRTDDPDRPVYWFVYRWGGPGSDARTKIELFDQGRITRRVVVQIDARTGETVKVEADNATDVGGRFNSLGM